MIINKDWEALAMHWEAKAKQLEARNALLFKEKADAIKRIRELEARLAEAENTRLLMHTELATNRAFKDELETRAEKAEAQAEQMQELLKANEQEIKGLVAQAIGASEQSCTAQDAVWRLVGRFVEKDANNAKGKPQHGFSMAAYTKPLFSRIEKAEAEAARLRNSLHHMQGELEAEKTALYADDGYVNGLDFARAMVDAALAVNHRAE